MGILDRVFKNRDRNLITNFFKTLNGYSPIFTNYEGGVYEMALTRSAIHSFASFCSKLKPEISGSAYKELEKILQFKPNPFMDTSKFLYRIATILSVNNNVFIVPMEDDNGRIIGYYPLLPANCEVVEADGEVYLRYTFASGERVAIEFHKVGIMTNYQYRDDFFGEDNKALLPTMNLLHMNNQGIVNAVKNSAEIRFIGRIANVLKPEDIKKEKVRFSEDNLSKENDSGLILYDGKFADLKQVESKPYTVNALQMQQIKSNVYDYFGTNENIMQNKYSEDDWNAYYEGKIEVFAIQLSLVLSNMTYSQNEISRNNQIYFTSNRLQYASNTTKLNVSTMLFDRGILTRNAVMDIWNMKHVEDGDKHYIRKEYAEVENLDKGVVTNEAITKNTQ